MATHNTLLVQDRRTNKSYEIPIEDNAISAASLKAIKGPIDGSKPQDKVENGLRVYDPGLINTAVGKTDMTWVDASRGVHLLRGYPPEQLRECDFEDILHLCAWRELPTLQEKESVRLSLAEAMCNVPSSVVQTVNSFPRTSHPMPMLAAGLSAYIAADPLSIPSFAGKTLYHGQADAVDATIINTTAAFGVVLGLVSSHRKGTAFVKANPAKNFYYNLLTMMGIVDQASRQPSEQVISAMREWGSAIADHGQAASQFAMSITTSTLADPVSSLISGLMAAYGPLHFGAQETAYNSMKKIGSPANVPAYINKIKQGKERMHGFGHRSYKARDPRVVNATKILDSLGGEAIVPEYAIAKSIERAVLADEFFRKRNLQANADLYGQFVYVAMGWESVWSPALVFLQRMPGLMAYWRNAMLNEKVMLIRPTDIFVGRTEPRSVMDEPDVDEVFASPRL